MQTFDQLAALVLPLMTAYQTDVTEHDKREIEEKDGVPFVHVTRASSSHIYFKPDHEWLKANVEQPHIFGRATPREIAEQALGLMTDYFNDEDAFHYHDGTTEVTKITRDTAIQLHRDWLNLDFPWGV